MISGSMVVFGLGCFSVYWLNMVVCLGGGGPMVVVC